MKTILAILAAVFAVSASAQTYGTNAVTGGDATLVFVKSLDGTTYDTSNTLRFTLAANSTSTVCLVTNVTLSSAGYLKLSTIENTTTNAITNVSVIYSAK